MRLGRSYAAFLASIILSACASETPTVSAPIPDRGQVPSIRTSITSDDGYYTLTELPEAMQEPIWIGDSPPLPVGATFVCPNPFPPPGFLTLPPLALWVTTAHMGGYPIQRRFTFPFPYTYQYQGTSGGKLYCGYTTPPALSADGDWELYGGTLVARSSIVWTLAFKGGLLTAVRYEGGNAKRIACGGQFIFDPSQPCDPPGGPSDPGYGGGGSGCENVWLIVEINYGDGTGWHELWSGYVLVCD